MPKRPPTDDPNHQPARRAVLQRLGLSAGGLALGHALGGCAPEGAPGVGGGAFADPDAGPLDAGSLDTGPLDADSLDGGPDGALGDPDAADAGGDNPDLGPEGPVDLQPVRGDGSHPFHYIEHLVVVQMENRSFDHYFGALTLEEGRDDVAGLTAEMFNEGPDGTRYSPFRLGHYITRDDPPHGRGPALAQFNDGAMDGFCRAHAARHGDTPEVTAEVMGYYNRADLPTLYGLADAFTICDHWFAAALAPTWPNRFFSHCADSDGRLGNTGGCAAPTPYLALVEAGGSYRCYFHNLFFTLTITSLPEKNAVKHDQFFADAAAGTLPSVSIVEPPFFMADDHPPADVRMGQAFLNTVYEAVRQSPCWPRTLMVVFYDENGGYFDHVPPPLSRGDARAEQGFDRLGFRVPGLVVGPLARRGAVCSTVLEHASVPALVSNVFGLPHVNERSALAGDLADALDLELVVGARRAPPPALAPVEVPMAALERALHADSGQPELEAWMREAGLDHHNGLSERRRQMSRFIRHARRLGAVRFR